MKCLNCTYEIKQSQKFCQNCGVENKLFTENKIDKKIDETITIIKDKTDKIKNEIKGSEYLNETYGKVNKDFNDANRQLVNFFFFVGILSILYSVFFETGFYQNPLLYTQPNYGEFFEHFGYFILIAGPLIILPLIFIYLKFNKASRFYKLIIVFVIIYLFLLTAYYENYFNNLSWQQGNPMFQKITN
jgi:hypothetical protein